MGAHGGGGGSILEGGQALNGIFWCHQLFLHFPVSKYLANNSFTLFDP